MHYFLLLMDENKVQKTELGPEKWDRANGRMPTRSVHVGLVLVLATASACGHSSNLVKADVVGAPRAVACASKPLGVEPLIVPGAITVFGEIHGTNEVPNFVADVACHASGVAPVVIGLEIFTSYEDSINRFLASDVTDASRQTLLAERFWEVPDGRASKAMLRLLEAIRAIKRAGRKIRVFTFDGTFGNGEKRDAGMAANIVRAVSKDEAARSIVLILTGNMHARTDSKRWMGWHLRNAFPKLRSLNNMYSGGSTWACTRKGCGILPLKPAAELGVARFVEIDAKHKSVGYDGIYYLGAVSASPPAVARRPR